MNTLSTSAPQFWTADKVSYFSLDFMRFLGSNSISAIWTKTSKNRKYRLKKVKVINTNPLVQYHFMSYFSLLS